MDVLVTVKGLKANRQFSKTYKKVLYCTLNWEESIDVGYFDEGGCICFDKIGLKISDAVEIKRF